VWFGYPCGTFSSARRFDGGPPPLRGTNSKDVWGLSDIAGEERARINSANKLLLRMNELMKLGENCKVPFYLENPQSSRLWMHPVIRKWLLNKSSHRVEFDYCQFGTQWEKSTSILSVGNKRLHTDKRMKCKVTWRDKDPICSKTGKPHETLSGFINGGTKGQC
jgi:hypothetical protein